MDFLDQFLMRDREENVRIAMEGSLATCEPLQKRPRKAMIYIPW